MVVTLRPSFSFAHPKENEAKEKGANIKTIAWAGCA